MSLKNNKSEKAVLKISESEAMSKIGFSIMTINSKALEASLKNKKIQVILDDLFPENSKKKIISKSHIECLSNLKGSDLLSWVIVDKIENKFKKYSEEKNKEFEITKDLNIEKEKLHEIVHEEIKKMII